MTSLDRMCAPWRRGRSRTCSSAAAPTSTAKRCWRCATRSRRSSGRTTACPCTRRCAARSSRSGMGRCSSSAPRWARCIRSPAGAMGSWRTASPASSRSCGRWPRCWTSSANCTATATAGRSRTRSCACWRPCARTPGSRSGRPGSRRSPTCSGWSTARGPSSAGAPPRFARSSTASTRRPREGRPRRLRSWRREPRACG